MVEKKVKRPERKSMAEFAKTSKKKRACLNHRERRKKIHLDQHQKKDFQINEIKRKKERIAEDKNAERNRAERGCGRIAVNPWIEKPRLVISQRPFDANDAILEEEH